MLLMRVGIVAQSSALLDEMHASAEGLPISVVFEHAELGPKDAFFAKLERLHLQVLFLELAHIEDAAGLVRGIRALNPAPSVFALHTHADPAAILEALRAGVSEYLVPPFRLALEAALQRVEAEARQQSDTLRAGGKVLGFLSSKGGCGATTVACHLARELPKETNSKVLITDCDFDAGLISFLFRTKTTYSLTDAAANLHRLDASYWKAVVSNGVPGLEMIGAVAGTNTQPLTPEALEQIFRFFRAQYDWVIADIGRGLTPFRISALTCCDEIYLVTTTEIAALHHSQRIITRLLEGGYNREKLRIVLNRPPKHFDVTLQELEKMLGAEILATIPNDHDAVNESYAEGSLAPATSAVGRAITELTRRIAGVQADKSKKRFSLFR